MQGALVPLKDAVDAFEQILDGKHDALPEAAFYVRCKNLLRSWELTSDGWRCKFDGLDDHARSKLR